MVYALFDQASLSAGCPIMRATLPIAIMTGFATACEIALVKHANNPFLLFQSS